MKKRNTLEDVMALYESEYGECIRATDNHRRRAGADSAEGY
jgi:hypothetical protein